MGLFFKSKKPNISSTPKIETLIDAVKEENIPKIKKMLDDGMDINLNANTDFAPDKTYKTSQFTKLLGDFDWRNEKPSNSWTPLVYAIILNNLEIIEMLLKNGANPNINIPQGTPLIFSIQKRKKLDTNNIVRLLLKHGADINLKETGTYFSPLTLAVVTHNVSIVKLLIENSAEVNSYQRPLEEWDWDGDMGNRKDITPIQHAVFGKQKEIVKLLLKAGAHPHGVGPINNYDNSCMTLNFSIWHWGDDEIIQLLLEAGANPNEGPLSGAVNKQNLDWIKMLIKHGADVKHESNWGESALSEAVKVNNQKIFNYFIRRGAKNYDALIWACAKGRLKMLMELLDIVDRIDDYDKDEDWQLYFSEQGGRGYFTPFMAAALGGDIKIYELLYNNNERLDFINQEGESFLSIACKEGKKDAVLFFQDKVKIYPFLFNCVKKDAIESLKAVIGLGVSLNGVYNGKTLLMDAVKKNSLEIISFLLDNNANINFKGDKGWTAMMIAAKKNRIEAAELLLKFKPDLQIRNESGKTAEDIAEEKKNSELLKLLSN